MPSTQEELANLKAGEDARLAELRSYGVLDSPPDPELDDLTTLAAEICGSPIAFFCLVDSERLFFASTVGVQIREALRERSLCDYLVRCCDGPLVVEDAQADPRFADMALVTGPPHLRFYAGVPVRTPKGHILGTLSVIDVRPRNLNDSQMRALIVLGRSVMHLLELRKKLTEMENAEAKRLETERALRARELEVLDRLRESEERFQAFMDNIPALCYMKDALGRFLFANRYMAQLFGREPSDLLGKTDASLMPDTIATELHENDRLVLASGQPQRMLESVPVPMGPPPGVTRIRHWLSYKFPFRARPGAELMLAGVSIDATEQYQMEAALREARDTALDSVRLKSEFLATMSHEIRTPMNGVIGMTELLLETELSKRQRSYAETIRASADALLAVINDILDFSKIEAGKLAFEQVELDVLQPIGEVIELLAARASTKGVELFSLVDGTVPRDLIGDPMRLRQVLTNLIGNGVKFTERGEVSLRVGVDSEDASTITLFFEVIDTGVGISPEQQRNLFQPFVQADGSMSRRFGGTGLGLAIRKQLVEMMGGTIWVESSPDQGSRFFFTARFKRSDAPRPSEALVRRALVVHAKTQSRAALERQLQAWGLETLAVESGAQAIEQLCRSFGESEAIEAVLIEATLPDMAGSALGEVIKKIPAVAGARLVLLTPLHWDGAEGLPEAFAGHLATPVHPAHLRAFLNESVVSSAPEPEAPREIKQYEPAASAVTEQAAASKAAAECQILFAEDNEVNVELARAFLDRLGYAATHVGTGRQAVEALRAGSYDIVLMDCQMPEMNGFEATAQIRALERETGRGRTPIIAMTANALHGDRERCLAAGMDDYLAKPITLQELGSVLSRWRSGPVRG